MLRIIGGVNLLGLSDYLHIYIHIGFPLVGLCLFWVSGTYGSCSKPELPVNSYTLKESKSTYATREVYEIFCVPGYTLSGSITLTCSSSGQWTPDLPSCSPSEGSYPWWMLLIGVTVFVIVVACIVPRLVHCLIGKRKKKEKSKKGQSRKDEDDEIGDSEYSNWTETPVTDFSRSRQSNIDYMSKIDGDATTLQKATENTAF